MESFEKLENEIRAFSTYSSLSITAKSPGKTRFQRVFTGVLHSCALLNNLTVIGFVYFHREDLVDLLTQLELSLVCFTFVLVLLLTLKKRDCLVEVMEWCKSQHDSAERRWIFEKALEDSQTGVKVLRTMSVGSFLTCSFGLLLFKYLLSGERFPLVFSVYYFGVPATSFWSYLLTLTIQMLAVASNINSTTIFHMWVLVCLRHDFASLETTLSAIEGMEKMVEDSGFETWLKLVHGSLTDATLYLNSVGKAASLVIYCEQKTMFTVLFVGYITAKMDPSNLPMSCALLFFVLVIFLVCSVNESVKQKYNDIGVALYELPWYEMKPKERRLLIPLMIAAQKHPVLRAGGLDEMTFDNFLNYIKGAYSTAILMEELIYAA